MTTGPLYFGNRQRRLYGMLHGSLTNGLVLACPALLQEGIRSQRAMWSLAEALADTGGRTLRFDWFGSGDSMGATDAMDFPGLLDDLEVAETQLRAGGKGRAADVWRLGLRSAALPLLAHAVTGNSPVQLVLWDPQLSGLEVVAGWRRQHEMQLTTAGRYPLGGINVAANELLGFEVQAELLESIQSQDAGQISLPSGSRVLVATWETRPDVERFITVQRAAGIAVEELLLEPADRPEWDAVSAFERQVLPRRSVVRLAKALAGLGWSQ